MDRFKAAQAAIDSMFEARRHDEPEERATDRILRYAKRGIDAPESLAHKEIQQICYALVVHYAQMGMD